MVAFRNCTRRGVAPARWQRGESERSQEVEAAATAESLAMTHALLQGQMMVQPLKLLQVLRLQVRVVTALQSSSRAYLAPRYR